MTDTLRIPHGPPGADGVLVSLDNVQLEYVDAGGQIDLVIRLNTQNSTVIEVFDNSGGVLLASHALSEINSLTVIGGDNSDDTLTVDFSNPFSIPGGIIFAGGDGGYDKLVLTGNSELTAEYVGNGDDDGTVIVSGEEGETTNVSYSGLEPFVYLNEFGAVKNSGVFNYGNSPEILPVDTFSQGSGDTLVIEIGGLTPGPGTPTDNGYDQINVTGTATLDGRLQIILINSFSPSLGQSFDIMTFGAVVGDFATFSGCDLGGGLYLAPVKTVDTYRLNVVDYDPTVEFGDGSNNLNNVIDAILAFKFDPFADPNPLGSFEFSTADLDWTNITIGQTIGGGYADLELQDVTLTFSGLAYDSVNGWTGQVVVEAKNATLFPGLLNIEVADNDDADQFAVVGIIYLAAGNDDSFLSLDDDLEEEDIGWPAFLDIEITDLRMTFDNFRVDDNQNDLHLSAGFLGFDTGNEALNDLLSADNLLFGLSIQGSASVTLAIKEIEDAALAIVSSDFIAAMKAALAAAMASGLTGVTRSISGNLFKVARLTGTFIFNTVTYDPDGSSGPLLERSATYLAVEGSLNLGEAITGNKGGGSRDGGFGIAFAISDLGPLQFFSFDGTGFLRFDNSGLVASLSLNQASGVPASFGFNFGSSTSYDLKINTTGASVDHDNNPSTPDIQSGLRLHITGMLQVGSVLDLSGTFDLTIDPDTGKFTIELNARISVFGTLLEAHGFAGIYYDANPGFAFKIQLKLGPSDGVTVSPSSGFTISGAFLLEINTSNADRDGIAPMSFKIEIAELVVNLFGFELSGSLTIGISPTGFSIDIPSTDPLTLDFFGLATLSVYGYLHTDHNFSFTATAGITIGDPNSFGVAGTISVTFSNSGFAATVTGQVAAFGVKISAGGNITITGAQVKLSIWVSAVLIPAVNIDINMLWPIPDIHIHTPEVRVSAWANWILGTTTEAPSPPAPPTLATRLSNGTLRLNLGADVTYRGDQSLYGPEAEEHYIITRVGAGESVKVSALGFEQTYDNIQKILVKDTQNGNTYIKIDSALAAVVNINAISTPTGNNRFITGAGFAIIGGGTGSNAIEIGSGGGTYTVGAGTGTIQTIDDNSSGNLTVYAPGFGNYQLSDDALIYGTNTMTFTDVKRVVLDGATDATYSISFTSGQAPWTGTAMLNGLGTASTVQATTTGNMLLTDVMLSASNAMGTIGTAHLSNIKVATLSGGAGDNTFTVTDWTGTATLNGAGGGDTYTVNLKGSGSGTTTINGSSGSDWATVNGTSSADTIVITTTQVTRGGETVNYTSTDTLVVNGNDGIDIFQVTDTSITTTINGNAGNDQFTINDSNSTLIVNGDANEDQFTVNGNSFALTLNGNDDSDTMTVNATGAALTMNGGDGDDTFNIGSIGAVATINAGPGSDTINVGPDSATVTVTVTPENKAPVAKNDDSAGTPEDTAVTIDVLANDTDVDGNPPTLMVAFVTQGANGTVTNNGTDVTYTPNADFNGIDSFTYTASDGNGGFDSATVTVTVTPVNDAPFANDDSVSIDEDTLVTIDVLANDTDVDGDPLVVSSVTQPTNGSVVINPDTDNTLTYTPAAGFTGEDSFTYTVDDGNGGSVSATVNITVSPTAPTTPVMVDDLVNVQASSLMYNRRTGLKSCYITITNTSRQIISGDVHFVINSLSDPNVSLVCDDGTTATGQTYDLTPYINLHDGRFDPDESITIRLDFYNPLRRYFTFDWDLWGTIG